jgi:ribosomal protein S21
VVREGESLETALVRLRGKVNLAYRRQWSKTRPGAYEKPSYRRRKKESLRNRNARLVRQLATPAHRCTVFIGLSLLFSPEETYQRKRLPFKPRRRWWGEH